MGEPEKIPILIIDRDVDCRDVMSRAFADNVDIEVLDTAPNGSIGLMKAHTLRPEVVILDGTIEDYSPVAFTRKLFNDIGPTGVVLVVNANASETVLVSVIRTLELGAFDFIVKPEKEEGEARRIELFKRRLVVRIRAYSIKRYSRLAMQFTGKPLNKTEPVMVKPEMVRYEVKDSGKYELLALGISTGGPKALAALIPALPPYFPLPVVIVIHLPDFFTASLAGELDKASRLKVCEAREGETPQVSKVYLAKGGRHLTLRKGGSGTVVFRYSDEPPVNNCRPSVDVLFSSIAKVYGPHVLGVIMTGMGNDGAAGIAELKHKGALTLAQDKESSIVWGMPWAAVNTGCIDRVLSLQQIVPAIMEAL